MQSLKLLYSSNSWSDLNKKLDWSDLNKKLEELTKSGQAKKGRLASTQEWKTEKLGRKYY